MGRCDLVPFLRAKKRNVPTLGTRFLVKFPRVWKAIEVKCPTYARGLPLGLNIDRCITEICITSSSARELKPGQVFLIYIQNTTMLRGFFGNLIFAIIARMLRGNHLNVYVAECLLKTIAVLVVKVHHLSLAIGNLTCSSIRRTECSRKFVVPRVLLCANRSTWFATVSGPQGAGEGVFNKV